LNYSTGTLNALNQTQGYFEVLEEVTKYNVQLSYLEKLWAVRSVPRRIDANANPIQTILTPILGMVPLHAK
jgi:methylsterol monooxygenase